MLEVEFRRSPLALPEAGSLVGVAVAEREDGGLEVVDFAEGRCLLLCVAKAEPGLTGDAQRLLDRLSLRAGGRGKASSGWSLNFLMISCNDGLDRCRDVDWPNAFLGAVIRENSLGFALADRYRLVILLVLLVCDADELPPML